jgi:polyisoprenoid-binding protein YceI
MKLTTSLFAATALLFTGTNIQAEELKLTSENTTIKFVGSKKDGKHEGSFKKIAGSITSSGQPETTQVQVTIDVDSMETDTAKLTAHLKSPDFFDVKRFPEAKFVSKSIKADGDKHLVTGELTMHGVTHPISFPAKVTESNGAKTISCAFDLNRNDWGISYGKGKVNDLVKMSIELKVK